MKLLLVIAGAAIVALAGTTAYAKDARYTGVASCTKKCHSKEKDGDALTAWQDSKHAEAYKTLATDEAKESAKKAGITGDPQKAEACLVCHTTGYGGDKRSYEKRFDIADGVQCEACHGAGSEYDKKRTMKKITEERGPDGKGDSKTAEKTGLIFPDENTCKTCHTQEIKFNGKTYKNPNYEEFDWAKQNEEIAHPLPEGKRAGSSDDDDDDDDDDEKDDK